jgi:hypothetical protein
MTERATRVLMSWEAEAKLLGGNGVPERSSLYTKGAFQSLVLFDYARDRDIGLGQKEPEKRRSSDSN